MFGMVGYSMMCFAIACVLTIIVGIFRPIKQNDDWKPWKYIVSIMVVLGCIPYLYVEVLTRTKGEPLKKGVLQAFSEANAIGPMDYYKVVMYTPKKAHVIATTSDRNEFGLPERAVFEIDLVKGKDGWEADAYTIVNSFHRQRDGSTMPPYW